MSNDKLAEALREVLTDINLVKCHWCKCHTWCSVEDACKTLAEHEAHAAEAAQARACIPSEDWFIEEVCEARNQWGERHEERWLETDDVHPDDFIGKWIRDKLIAAAPQQAAEPVAVIESAEDRHGPYLTHANVVLRVWNGYVPKAGDEIYTHQQPAQDAKDAARYRWLREHHDSTRPDWHIRTPTNDAPAIGALDAAIDAAMAKESGNG